MVYLLEDYAIVIILNSKTMNAEIINGMISNSSWIDPVNKSVFKFSDGNNLIINGRNQKKYCLGYSGNKIIFQIGSSQFYYIDYINDFILNFYNEAEKFSITPE